MEIIGDMSKILTRRQQIEIIRQIEKEGLTQINCLLKLNKQIHSQKKLVRNLSNNE